MKLTTIDRVIIAPGRVDTWPISTSHAAQRSPTGPSENERFHLKAVRGGGTGWLAVMIELPGPFEPDVLTDALRALLDRHDVLRSYFVVTDPPETGASADDGFVRFTHARGSADVRARSAQFSIDADTGMAALESAINATCTPFEAFPHFFAAVRHEHSTTVVCAFDHCYVDALSLAIIAEDLLDHFRGIEVPAAGSFLAGGGAEVPAAAPSDDPRLVPWRALLQATDWAVPAFPLELGVDEGDRVPPHIDIRTIYDAPTAERFDALARAEGLRTYPAMVACLATAIFRAGGPDRTAMIIPVHTRNEPGRKRAVGWFVSNAPLLVDGSDPDLLTAMRRATGALRSAVFAADVGLSTVFGVFGEQIRMVRHDVFMVSYVDYRRFDLPDWSMPQHVSSSSETDALQLWFWRDRDGLHLRARYPSTETGRSTAAEVLDELVDLAESVIST